MSTTEENSTTLDQLQSYSEEIFGAADNFIGGFSEAYENAYNNAVNSGKSELAKKVEAFQSSIRANAHYADLNAQKYASNPNLSFSKTYQNLADYYNSVADDFVSRQIATENEFQTFMSDMKSRTLSDLGAFGSSKAAKMAGEYLGPAFDTYQIASAISNQDWNSLGSSGTSIVTAELFVLGAMLAVGTLPLSGTVAVFVGVAGVIGGLAGEKLWDTWGEWTSSKLSDLISSLQDDFGNAEALASPLILDLDGNGVSTTALSGSVHFDHDGNGFAESTGWVGEGDGLLVLDRNSNGTIDNGSELFGNASPLKNGGTAANGFAALADLDSNKDGVIDNRDTAYASLRVWKDANQNGVVDTGELLTLSGAGVANIRTSYQNISAVDENGNHHLQAGKFTRSDGSVSSIEDVWFRVDYAKTEDVTVNQDSGTTITNEIAALPQMAGFGNVHSLHDAMALDTTGTLQGLVTDFVQAQDRSTRLAIANDIVLHWAGADAHATDSRGENLKDGRILYALEAFLGESYSQTNWGSSPGPQASQLIARAYDDLLNHVYGMLMIQSHLKPLLDKFVISAQGDNLSWDASAVISSLRDMYEEDPGLALDTLKDVGTSLKLLAPAASTGFIEQMRAAGNVEGSAFDSALATLNWNALLGDAASNEITAPDFVDSALYGFSGDDVLRGMAGNDQLQGGDGKDMLYGGAGDDILTGGAGDDTLYGNAGNDMLTGGAGNDYLNGGSGNDTYLFEQWMGTGPDFQLRLHLRASGCHPLHRRRAARRSHPAPLRRPADHQARQRRPDPGLLVFPLRRRRRLPDQ